MPTGDDHQLPQGYTFRETLSRGRTITVVRAHSARHGEVVVKSWTEPLSDDAARAAFEREARLHESLSPDAAPHPNIVAFVEASTDWELPWIATRPGGSTLSDVLAKRALGREEALRISRDILDGLSVLHERRLVHGDLTPRNILIYNGRATLCDLGLAGTPGELPLTPQVGTPEYMAPELLADPGRGPDCRSDVYAAGRVLGDVLDGQCLPPRMEHLVYARAVSARPSDRPSGAGALARAFRRAEPQSPRPTTRRRIAIFAGSLALALVAGSAGSAWWWSHRPTTHLVTTVDGWRTYSPITPSGHERIGPDESVWIVQRSGTRAYELYVTPATIEPDRRGWSLVVDLGFGPCDEGKEFDVWALALPDASPIAVSAMQAHAHGGAFTDLPALPVYGRTLGHARVTMMKFQGSFNRCPGVTQELTSTPLE